MPETETQTRYRIYLALQHQLAGEQIDISTLALIDTIVVALIIQHDNPEDAEKHLAALIGPMRSGIRENWQLVKEAGLRSGYTPYGTA